MGGNGRLRRDEGGPREEAAAAAARLNCAPFMRRWFPLIVFLSACLQYINTVSYDYAWDDKLAITANAYTKKGVRGLPEIFTKRVSVPYKSEYRPVPQALHAVEYEAFGSNPHTGHL